MSPIFVIPAYAGTQHFENRLREQAPCYRNDRFTWVPAFAQMTREVGS